MLPMQAHAAPCNAACVDGDIACMCAHFGSEGLDLVCAGNRIGAEGAAAVADKLASVPGLTTLDIGCMQHVGGRRQCRVGSRGTGALKSSAMHGIGGQQGGGE